MTQVLSLWRGVIQQRRTKHDIADEAANKHGVSIEAMRGGHHTRAAKAARLEAYATMRDELHLSNGEIGRYFNRDKTAVDKGILSFRRKVAQRMAAE